MYKVNDIFYSLQGEGRNTGRAAVFVRFSGCNLACSFCDTDFSSYEEFSADDIVNRMVSALPADVKASLHGSKGIEPMVVLTGGEPTLQVDASLIGHIHDAGFRFIAMESNGMKRPETMPNWLTVSPKARPAVKACNELKVVFDGQHEPDDYGIKADYYYLQPMDTGNAKRNAEITASCIDYIKAHPRWRLSLQTHKLVGIK